MVKKLNSNRFVLGFSSGFLSIMCINGENNFEEIFSK